MDNVARHLNTTPFDPKVGNLSEFQAELFLELRHPYDQKEAEKRALERDSEDKDAEDVYTLGEVQVRDDTPDDALDLALSAQ